MNDELNLPPLPEPFMELHREISPLVYQCWADQMREYAKLAVEAEREAVAQLAERTPKLTAYASGMALQDHIAAAIRARSAKLDIDAYNARARPRLAAIDALSSRIDFGSYGWQNTPEGERYQRLMNEQARDEEAAGL